MCHLQDVCDESKDFTMSIIERGWRSYRIRCRLLKLCILYLKERLRCLFNHKKASKNLKVDISSDRPPTLLKPGDMVITLGAGNIYEIGERLLKDMKEKNE